MCPAHRSSALSVKRHGNRHENLHQRDGLSSPQYHTLCGHRYPRKRLLCHAEFGVNKSECKVERQMVGTTYWIEFNIGIHSRNSRDNRGPGSSWGLFTIEPTLKCWEVEITGFFNRGKFHKVNSSLCARSPNQISSCLHAREVTEELAQRIQYPAEFDRFQMKSPTNNLDNECTIRYDLVKGTSYNIMKSRRIERSSRR